MKYFISFFLLLHMLSLHIIAVVYPPRIPIYPHSARFFKPVFARDERFQRDILRARNSSHHPFSGKKGRVISISKAFHFLLKKTVAVQGNEISLARDDRVSGDSTLGVISFLDSLISFPHDMASFEELLSSFSLLKIQEVSQSVRRPTDVMKWFFFLGWYP